MAFGLENEATAYDIKQVIRFITYDKPQEPNYELGPWDYPIAEFLARFEQLKRNSPQYTDEEAAAVVYFGMVAQQPTPTAEYTDISIDWDTVDTIAYNLAAYDPRQTELGPNGILVLFDLHLLIKKITKANGGSPYFGIKKIDGKRQIYFLGHNVRTTRTLQESYVAAVYHLNRYLVWNGLYDGILKTLAEESRKLQGLRAKALASQAAAAKALALSKASENVSEEVVERYEQQLAEAQEKEKEITDYLQKLLNTPQGQGSTTAAGTSGLLPLAIGAAAALFALR